MGQADLEFLELKSRVGIVIRLLLLATDMTSITTGVNSLCTLPSW